MISPATIDAVKQLSILDVVSKYVPDLKKAGANWRAASPFTEEKTPSFYLVPNRGFFKCFSSGKGGDHITFVIEKFGITYIDAVKLLCQDFRIDIKYEENGHAPEYYDTIKLLYKINHATANRYAEQLQQIFAWPLIVRTQNIASPPTPWYEAVFNELILHRKFTHDTILQWQIGYAPGTDGDSYTPEKWNFLASTLIKNGYYEQGIDLGLIKTKSSVNYDTFRSRIIYPIIDHDRKYVGFGGRTLKEVTGFNPKYLNSPNSPEGKPQIFVKEKTLYGLHYAGEAIRKQGYANLMEGYTDVISFHQAGINNTVGTCGTALTGEQCKLLKKYTNRVVLFFDGDEAGQNASMRGIDLLMQHGFLTSIVPMPSMITLKYEPTEENPGPFTLPWAGPEAVFITHRDKETLMVKHGRDEIEFGLEDIEAIDKVDPDELVRMLANV